MRTLLIYLARNLYPKGGRRQQQGATQFFRVGGDEEAAWSYLDGFNELVGQYTDSGGAPSQLVATGEYIAGVSFAHDLLNVRDAGFPIELVYPRPGWSSPATRWSRADPTQKARRCSSSGSRAGMRPR